MTWNTYVSKYRASSRDFFAGLIHHLTEKYGLRSSTLPKDFEAHGVLHGIPWKVVKSRGGYAKHRIFAQCGSCHQWIPAGRLHQHLGTRACYEAKMSGIKTRHDPNRHKPSAWDEYVAKHQAKHRKSKPSAWDEYVAKHQAKRRKSKQWKEVARLAKQDPRGRLVNRPRRDPSKRDYGKLWEDFDYKVIFQNKRGEFLENSFRTLEGAKEFISEELPASMKASARIIKRK